MTPRPNDALASHLDVSGRYPKFSTWVRDVRGNQMPVCAISTRRYLELLETNALFANWQIVLRDYQLTGAGLSAVIVVDRVCNIEAMAIAIHELED